MSLRMSCLAGALCLGVAPMGTPAVAQELESGAELFKDYCAQCHGADGGGGGALVENRAQPLPDLRTLTRRNDGGFPFRRIVETVDGREEVAMHGERFMPAWGDVFRFKEDQGDILTHARILNLVWYLRAIQQE